MIQANELRIGNWVLIDNGQTPTYTYEITAHDIEEIEGCGDDTFPILLTPSILYKCGFEAFNETPWPEWRHPNGFFMSDTLRGNCSFDVRLMRAFDVEIKHLHQLQNLFYAITGTELQINLTTP